MPEYIQSFLLGFAVTAIPGAVFFETIRRTIVDKSSILKFLMGSFSGTFLIIASILLGLSSILAEKSLANLFYGLSALVLIYIGISSATNKSTNKNSKSRRKVRSFYSSFITGFILGSANPISILFWISVLGKMLQTHQSVYVVIANSLLMLAGALSVYLILIPLTSRSKDLLKAKNLLIISR